MGFWDCLFIFFSETDDVTLSLTSLLIFWTAAEQVPPLGFPDRLKIAFYTRQVV